MPTEVEQLKIMVRGAYDLQKLRIQCGLRLAANFRAKLGAAPSTPEEDMEEDAIKVIAALRKSYRLLCSGIARNRTLPKEEGFAGDELISTYAELVLVDQYMRLEKCETDNFSQLTITLEKIPIYNTYLEQERGIGPAMAGVLISSLDPHKAPHISSFWKYAGLDVAQDGLARSRRAEHLVERSYINKDGDEATKVGVTFQPFLRSKLLGVLAGSFMRSDSRWRQVYDDYKRRIETDPAREKVTLADWKKRHKAGEDMSRLWPPGRINNAAKRYMVKMFLAELWTKWRELEGLPVTLSYNEARRNRPHRDAA